MKKLHPAVAAAALAFALGVVLSRSGYGSHGPIDTAIFIVFLAFFWWLISDFSGGKAGKSMENSIAFRFGRLLSASSGATVVTFDQARLPPETDQ